MDLVQLRYFRAIASCGSLSAAARTLGVSQPTLTTSMKNLEEELGTTLLLRDRTGVRLTTTGEQLLRHAADVLSSVERATREIRGLETEDVGRFVIGCHESLGAYFLPTFMSKFLRASPRIELSLWNGSSADVARAVIDREVHFGLVVNPAPYPDLVLVDLFHDAVDLFVVDGVELSPASRRIQPGSATKAERSWEEAVEILRAGPLVFPGRVGQCQTLVHKLGEDGLLPHRTLSCGDFELVKSLTLAGVGVGMLPRRVAAYGNEGKLTRLHPKLPSFPDVITLAYHSEMHRTRAAMRLKDALAEHGKELDAG